MSYDAHKRLTLLQKLRERTRSCPPSSHHHNINGNMLVFKTEYGRHLRFLKIREEIGRLITSLRQVIGDTFLRNAQIVTAHPLQCNLFRRHYRFNFVPGSMGLKKRGFREGGFQSGI